MMFLFLIIVLSNFFISIQAYDPTWESLDKRPLPRWYDEAKFGIFIHWGVFSVPSYKGEWFWSAWGRNGDADPTKNKNSGPIQKFVQQTELPHFAYADYVHRFDATLYNPQHWSTIFAKSGAQYVVLTSKHHEGFCNWDSRSIPTTWNYNSMDVGPRRDLVGELAEQVKNMTSNHTQQKLHFGLYHSLYEWFNPLYDMDKEANFTTTQFVQLKTMPELYDIVNKYSPEIIWSDGSWDAHSDYWNSKQFLAWYATNSSVSKTAVWNDRWGTDAGCKHGSFLTCADRYLPNKLKTKKWENALTITTTSWGYDRSLTLESYYTTEYLIHTLIQTVAFNGNMLLNVGPRADGTLDPIFEERLSDIGKWLFVNGEAIYGTRPWNVVQQETASKVFYTTKTISESSDSNKNEDGSKTLYALFTEWPDNSELHLASPITTDNTEVRLLGYNNYNYNIHQAMTKDSKENDKKKFLLKWRQRDTNQGMDINLPAVFPPGKAPCQHAWTVAITNIANFGFYEIDGKTSSRSVS